MRFHFSRALLALAVVTLGIAACSKSSGFSPGTGKATFTSTPTPAGHSTETRLMIFRLGSDTILTSTTIPMDYTCN
jgi:hypothetical protein